MVRAFLFVAIAGGVLAVAIAIRRGRLGRTVGMAARLLGRPTQVEIGDRIAGRAQQIFLRPGHRYRMRHRDVDRRFSMKMRRTRERERGSAMVETAICIPLLLVLMVGIFEVGRAYETWQVLTNAAREGARMAVMPSSNPDTTTGAGSPIHVRRTAHERRRRPRSSSTRALRST